MALAVRHVTDNRQCEEVWDHFREPGIHPALASQLTSLSVYEDWKTRLAKGVGSFWTSQGERLAFLVAYLDGKPVGLVRVLRVPIYPWDREDWGTDGFRGEIQDLLYEGTDAGYAVELVNAAVSFLKEKGIGKIGASCWRPDQCKVLGRLSFKPFRRNILLGWRTDKNLHVEPNFTCNIHYVRPGEEKLVQEVFTSTWGFPVTFLPRWKSSRHWSPCLTDAPLAGY